MSVKKSVMKAEIERFRCTFHYLFIHTYVFMFACIEGKLCSGYKTALNSLFPPLFLNEVAPCSLTFMHKSKCEINFRRREKNKFLLQLRFTSN